MITRNVRVVGGQDQLARGLRIFQHADAGRFQQRQGFLENAALGQRQRQLPLVVCIVCVHLILSMSAPTAASFASIRS